MTLFGLAARLRNRRRSRGQSLVEFALILPLLLVFLATVLDLGRIYYANISLLNAAREGAFQASKTPKSYVAGQPCNTSTNLIVCRVQLESKGSMVQIPSANIGVTCSKSGCPLEANSTVTVQVSGQFKLLTPILGFVFGGQTLGLKSAATQQIEYYPTGGVSTLPPSPVAVFTVSDTTGEAPFAVSFDATASTGSPTDFIWDFGDGTYANGQAQVTHVYTTPGTYTVTLRIINLAGDATATATIDITGNTPSPTASASATASPSAEVCDFPPNVVNKNLNVADAALTSGGWTYDLYPDLDTGAANKIQAQSPDHTECVLKSTTVVKVHYRPN